MDQDGRPQFRTVAGRLLAVATSALGLSHLVSGQRVETSTLTAKIDTSSNRGSELLATPDPATSLAVRASARRPSGNRWVASCRLRMSRASRC
jgi:hypothetical protein